MEYKIRLATVDDIKNLAILKQKVWDETYRGIYDDAIIDNFDYEKSEGSFQSIINNDKISLYVVEAGNELVGYMAVGEPTHRFKDYEQELGLLYLRTSYRGKGIGKKLFTLAYREVKNNGYKRFLVSCNKYNTDARGFYEKMGGKIIHEDEDKEDKRKTQIKYHYDINK